jgi:hypothetical protein
MACNQAQTNSVHALRQPVGAPTLQAVSSLTKLHLLVITQGAATSAEFRAGHAALAAGLRSLPLADVMLPS